MKENQDSQTGNVLPDKGDVKVLPVGILRFRKQVIMLVHIAAFAVSLMMAFLLVNNMQFRAEWLASQYSSLLVFFIKIGRAHV